MVGRDAEVAEGGAPVPVGTPAEMHRPSEVTYIIPTILPTGRLQTTEATSITLIV